MDQTELPFKGMFTVLLLLGDYHDCVGLQIEDIILFNGLKRKFTEYTHCCTVKLHNLALNLTEQLTL